MADPIVIIVDADARNAQGEFTKVNTSMQFLAESAARAAATANSAFQKLFQGASQSARAEMQEMARIYQQRIQMAYDEAKAAIAALEIRKRAVSQALQEEVRALNAAQDVKTRKIAESILIEQRLLDQRKQMARDEANARIRIAEETKYRAIQQAREERDKIAQLIKDATAAGRGQFNDPRNQGRFTSTSDTSYKQEYTERKRMLEQQYRDEISGIRARRDAAIKADEEVVSRFKKNQQNRTALSQQETADAVKQAQQKAAVVQAGLDQELAAAKRNFREKKTEADRDLRESLNRMKQMEESALSFSRLFGANFVADLAARTFLNLITSMRDYIKEATLYAARTEELGIALHAVARANNVATESVDAQEKSIIRLNITTQDTRQVLARFVAAQFDIAKANKLAVVAQDLAVIAGRTTAEEFEKLNDAIQTLQTRNLRTAGVFITVDQVLDQLAKTTGRARNSFTTLEKQTAVLNAVLEYGARVTGTYEAAMTTALKQMRSTERFLAELKNAFGSLFTGILFAIVTVLNPFLEWLGKNRAALIGMVFGITAVTAAVVLAASRTLPSMAAISLAFEIAAKSVFKYNSALALANTTSLAATRFAGILGIVAILGSLAFAAYSAATATEELKGANDRTVDYLLATNKQILINIDYFGKHRDEINEGVEVQGRYNAALQLLNPAESARLSMLKRTTGAVDELNKALGAQLKINEDLINIERVAAAGAVLKALDQQKGKYTEITQSLEKYRAASKVIEEREAAFEAKYPVGSEIRQRNEKLLSKTGGAAFFAETSKYLNEIQQIGFLKRELEATGKLVGASASEFRSAQEAVDRFAAPLAQVVYQENQLANTLPAVNATQAEQVEWIKKVSMEATTNIDVLKGNKEAQQAVADAIGRTIQQQIRQANRFREAGGAALELVEALNKVKIAELDVERTPSGARQVAQQVGDSVQQLYQDIYANAPPKELGPGAEGVATRIARDMGITPEQLQSNKELIDRYVAGLNEARLRAFEESAKSVRATLGEEAYQNFLKEDGNALLHRLSQVSAQAAKVRAETEDPFEGITRSGRVAKTEMEKLAEQIRKVEAETTLLAKGGSRDDLDRARLRRAESIRDRVRGIYEQRFELGVDTNTPINTERNALAASEAFYDRLESIQDLRQELRIPMESPFPATDEGARAEIERLNRIVQLRDQLRDATMEQYKVSADLAMLTVREVLPVLSAETRAHIQYRQAIQDRRNAEQELTAQLIVLAKQRNDALQDEVGNTFRAYSQLRIDLFKELEGIDRQIKEQDILQMIFEGRELEVQQKVSGYVEQRAPSELQQININVREILNAISKSLTGREGAGVATAAASRASLNLPGVGATAATLASGALGVREIGGANRGPEIARYMESVGLTQGQMWCAAFVNYFVRGAEDVLKTRTPFPKTASTEMIEKWARENNLLTANPEVGAVFLEYGRRKGRYATQHTGFVESVDREGGTFTTIEGNYQDKVSRVTRKMGDKYRFVVIDDPGGPDETVRKRPVAQQALPQVAAATSPFSGGLYDDDNQPPERIETIAAARALLQKGAEGRAKLETTTDTNKAYANIIQNEERLKNQLISFDLQVADARLTQQVARRAEARQTQVEMTLLEEDLTKLLAGDSQTLLELRAQQDKARLEDRISLQRDMVRLSDELRRYEMNDAETIANVRKRAATDRVTEQIAVKERLIQLEEEITNAAVGQTDRYREARLSVIKEIQGRDEEAVKRQIKAQAELGDSTVFHSEQVRANVLDFLVQQGNITEGVSDAFKTLYTGIISPLDRAMDHLGERTGALGAAFAGLIKTVGRLALNRLFTTLIDAIPALRPTVNGTQAGGATDEGGGGVGSLLGGAVGVLLPNLGPLGGGAATGGRGGVAAARTSNMMVTATTVIVNAGSVIGTAAGALGGGGGINLPGFGPGGAGFGWGAGGGGATTLGAGAPGSVSFGGTPSFVPGIPGGGIGGINLPGFGAGGGGFGWGVGGGPTAMSGDLAFPTTLTTGTTTSGVGAAASGGITSTAKSLFSKGGLKQNIAGALPLMGFSLGSALGGTSGAGSIFGGVGGLAAGAVGLTALAPALATSIFGGTIAGVGGATASTGLSGFLSLSGAGGPITLAIAGALLLGSFFLGRSKKRREEEKIRTQVLTDAKSQLSEIVSGVKSDRIDGDEALLKAAEIRGNYMQQVGQLTDKKTRRIAEATVRELDYIIESVLRPAVKEQFTRREFVEAFVPTYDMGGRVSTQSPGSYSRFGVNSGGGISDVTGFGLLPGSFRGRDTHIVAIAEGETVLGPREVAALGGRNRMRQIGVRGYASAGVVGSVAPPASSVAPSSGSGGGSPPVVYAIIVYSKEEAARLARMLPHAVIAEKVAENVSETGGAGLPALFESEYQRSY